MANNLDLKAERPYMLIQFFVFINFSHLRARGNTLTLSHTRTGRQNFSAREANAATCMARWPLQHVHVYLPGAEHRDYASTSKAKAV